VPMKVRHLPLEKLDKARSSRSYFLKIYNILILKTILILKIFPKKTDTYPDQLTKSNPLLFNQYHYLLPLNILSFEDEFETVEN
jgi:hypothetical protein